MKTRGRFRGGARHNVSSFSSSNEGPKKDKVSYGHPTYRVNN